MKLYNSTSSIFGFFLAISEVFLGWGDGGVDKVLLRDIQTLTLYDGKMTSGRRSSPVPQLNCVGGTAGCKTFTPKVVQCYNRGSDQGKTDMNNDYRFGKIQVNCEGFDDSQDLYVLKGSCGLEYTLDLTNEPGWSIWKKMMVAILIIAILACLIDIISPKNGSSGRCNCWARTSYITTRTTVSLTRTASGFGGSSQR